MLLACAACKLVGSNEPRAEVIKVVVDWLKSKCPAGEGVLNVAGTRGSKAPGIQQGVTARMIDVISLINDKMFYPFGDEG